VTTRVGVIDYGVGNLGSMIRMVELAGSIAIVISEGDQLSQADRLILPGVGHFDHGVKELHERGLFQGLRRVDPQAQPLLGVCLGMQLLMETSEEGSSRGLGLIPGTSLRIAPARPSQKVPHMGWNTVTAINPDSQIAAQAEGSRYYFVHSYVVTPAEERFVAGHTHYVADFCSAIDSGDGILGYQFHPEKSHKFGLALLRQFVSPQCS
jgi:glutamine amidotransferase